MITLNTPSGPIAAELAVPEGAGPWPGVVVVHDVLGLSEDICKNVARFADNGYLAIAPDLYSRGGTVRCITAVLRSLSKHSGEAVDDLHAARDLLIERADCTGKVGIAGFCMGGGFALVMGPKGFDAAAPFYPSIIASYDSMVRDSCPVVASFGRRDPVNPGSARRLQKALDRNNIPNDVKAYRGAGHSFANEIPAQPFLRIVGFGYDADSTDDAYRRVFAFFGSHLGAGTPQT